MNYTRVCLEEDEDPPFQVILIWFGLLQDDILHQHNQANAPGFVLSELKCPFNWGVSFKQTLDESKLGSQRKHKLVQP